MNPCSRRDTVYSAGKLTPFAMFDWQSNFNGFRYSSQSGWMVLTGRCGNGSSS